MEIDIEFKYEFISFENDILYKLLKFETLIFNINQVII